MRFDDLEDIAFEKNAGPIWSGAKALLGKAVNPMNWFRGGQALGHAPTTAVVGAGRQALNLAGRGAEAVGNSSVGQAVKGGIGYAANKANQALVNGVKGAGVLAADGVAGAAGVASGVGRGVIEQGVLPAGRWAATRFQKAPIASTLGLVGAAGSAQNVGSILSGDVYNSHRMNQGLSTPNYAFGTEKFNPLAKFGEEHMSRYPRLHDLEKVAAPIKPQSAYAVAHSGTVSHMLADKIALPMASAMMMPFFAMIGQKAVQHMFTPETRMDTEGVKAKGMAEYLGKEDVKKLESSKKERETRPKMNEVFTALRKSDKVINEAYQDPHLKGVLHNTMETVYAFAPDVAKDHRTMQSVLREAITAPDGGLSFQTAKQLAETQKFISESRGTKR